MNPKSFAGAHLQRGSIIGAMLSDHPEVVSVPLTSDVPEIYPIPMAKTTGSGGIWRMPVMLPPF